MENRHIKIILTSLTIFFINKINSQNLVNNPSFEDYIQCPDDHNQIERALDWYNPNVNTPDYFNSCTTNPNFSVPSNIGGYKVAHSGFAYAGIYVYSIAYTEPQNSREYAQGQLTKPLTQGQKYVAGFYCSLRENLCNTAINNLCMAFTNNLIHQSNVFNIDLTTEIIIQPSQYLDSKSDWLIVSDTFTSDGNEVFFTIGNFNNDSLTDTINVPNNIPNWPYGGVYASSYYYIDDVFVIPLDSLTDIKEPKPLQGKVYTANGQLVLELEENYKPINLSLSTATGQTVWQHQEFFTQGQRAFSLPLLPGGLYFVEVQCGGGVLRQKVVVWQE